MPFSVSTIGAATRTLRSTAALLAAAALIAGCSQTYGPSVPSQPGKSFFAARDAYQKCLPTARATGQNTMTSSYIMSVLLGGLVLGPVIVASNQDGIRYSGEAGGLDKCLADAGYVRRDLTPQEIKILNNSFGERRMLLLDQLVAGETIDPGYYPGQV
jgi:hypothetical protein